MSGSIHTGGPKKFSRICCQFHGKGIYYKVKHQGNIHIYIKSGCITKKQPWVALLRSSHPVFFKSVLKKRCSENIQQIYRRTPMSKCDFNKVSETIFPIKITIHSFLMSDILKKYTPNASKNHKTIYQRIFMSFALIVNISIHIT